MEDKNDHSEINMIMFLVVCVGIAYFLHSHYVYYAYFWKYLRLIELSCYYIIPDQTPLYSSLHIREIWHFIWSTSANSISSTTIDMIDQRIGFYTNLPFSLIVFNWGMCRLYTGNRVDTIYNARNYLEYMATLYPHLRRCLEVDFLGTDLDYDRDIPESKETGMGMTPLAYSLACPPMHLEKIAARNSNFRRPIYDGFGDFDRDLAERSFKAQLGNRYYGLDSLNELERKCWNTLVKKYVVNVPVSIPFLQKALATILGLKGKQKLNIERINASERAVYKQFEKMVLRDQKAKRLDPNSLLKQRNMMKYVLNSELEPVLKQRELELVMEKHAFIRCGLLSCFELVKQTGVQVEEQIFDYVKREDRVLWFCFSATGRKVAWAECAGVWCHRLVEMAIGEPMMSPIVDNAVKGLYRELKIAEYLEKEPK